MLILGDTMIYIIMSRGKRKRSWAFMPPATKGGQRKAGSSLPLINDHNLRTYRRLFCKQLLVQLNDCSTMFITVSRLCLVKSSHFTAGAQETSSG